jgi:hypothetical protein
MEDQMSIRGILRAWWKSFLIITLVAFSIFLIINITNPANDLLKIFELLGAGVATVTGIAGAWGWFDGHIVRRNELVRQVLNQVPDVAKSAISYLNTEGYLHNGSLKGVDLSGARLSGVDLKAKNPRGRHVAANLENVNLKQANLSNADMREINLKGANLDMTNLETAWLMDADLRNANFECTNLQGTKLLKANLQGARFKGVLLDENTVLPDGSKWTENTDLSRFGIVDLDKPSVSDIERQDSVSNQIDSARLSRLSEQHSDFSETVADESNEKNDPLTQKGS